MALTVRTLGLGAAAVLLAAGGVIALTTNGWRLGDLSRPKTAATQTSSPDKETIAVKRSRLPPPEQKQVSAEAAPPAEVPPSSLRGLDEVPLTPVPSSIPADQATPKAFDPNPKAKETLPWDLVEPVLVPSPPPVGTRQTPTPAGPAQTSTTTSPPPLQLPTEAMVSTWLKAKTTEIKGEDRSRPLMHFEFWLEPPPRFRGHLLSVTYNFSTPAIDPQTQTSRDASSGFRISVGGLGCADTITLTLMFDDGRTQSVAIDGCQAGQSR